MLNPSVKVLLRMFEYEMVYPNPTQDLILAADFAAEDGWSPDLIQQAVNISLAHINHSGESIN